MLRIVTAGFDGSPESLAAAEWAAREARLRGLLLKLVHVREPVPDPMAQAPLPGAETHRHWSGRSETGVPPAEGWGRIPREAAEGIRARHPGIDVTTEQLNGHPAEALLKAADDAALAVQEAEAVTEVLRPWREKYPSVEIIGDTLSGKAASHLVDASREASLVVVGRRVRRAALGAHLGPVAHAVLHHSSAPVTVVPYD
jgi:nucleotide-binding universal stress UspA family protein